MPLSQPKPRKPLHHREVICQGFLRDDGLIDIEGQLTDTKMVSLDNEIHLPGLLN